MSRRLAQMRGFSVCETGYGVSFARRDYTLIEEGIVRAKPDLVRTESKSGSGSGTDRTKLSAL